VNRLKLGRWRHARKEAVSALPRSLTPVPKEFEASHSVAFCGVLRVMAAFGIERRLSADKPVWMRTDPPGDFHYFFLDVA
jgi:hypothetical protein